MTVSEAWVDFLAGWASGAVAVATCQPVDTVLTRLQAGESLVVGSSGSSASSSPTSIRVQFQSLTKSYGVSSLWRGSSAMISAVPMQNALLMGGYGMGKQFAEGSTNESERTVLASIFIGGMTGGVLQSFFMSPVELVKVNQQVHDATKTARMASLELWNGLLLFAGRTGSSWRGLNATLLRDGIPHGVWFVSYEWCKTTLTRQYVTLSGGIAQESSIASFSSSSSSSSSSVSSTAQQVAIPLVSGAFAATVAWVSTIL